MEQNKTIQLYRILLFLLGVLFVWVLLPKCCDNEQPIKTDLNKDTVHIYSVKVDSIDVIRTKIVTKYKSIRDTINIHDTLEVIQALNTCDTIIVVDSLEIAFLKTINRNFAKIVYNDSLEIDSLKSSKKKYFKGFRHGLITGTIFTSIGISTILLNK